jgi:V-type H+-transporting ATPase subunit C
MLVQSQDSEHLETHLVAVPSSNIKDFNRSYETLCPMIVPRSAQHISSDDEFSLYAVTTFKKHSQEFIHKVREKKWVPRDFKYSEGGKEEEARELRKTESEEKRVWGEALRLGRTGWSEAVMGLVHVVVLRVFVEGVLRYGLPLDFVGALVKVCSSFSTTNPMLISDRLIANAPKRRGREWIRPSRTWLEMPLAGTARAESRRMKVWAEVERIW